MNPDPGVRTYVCENGETIEAGYPDASSAMVRYRGRPIPMKAARAASGVRYVGYGLQWWTRGMDEGRLSILKDGEDVASDPGITCRVGGTSAPAAPPPTTQDPAGEAVGVVRSWFARAAAGQATEADWTEAGQASRAALAKQMAAFQTLTVEVGPPGAVEGAAGSLYLEAPLSLKGRLKAGGEAERTGKVVMRRVNDVPGSTDAQRRWRIERVELEPSTGD